MFSKRKEVSEDVKVKKSPVKASKIPSIIGSDVVIVGNVSSQGVIQLEGKIEGDINIRQLTVGHDGWVDGSVNADEAILKGKVTGTIKARKVVLEKTAKVHGDIQHEIISIEAGALIEGSMNAIDKKVTELPTAKTGKEKVKAKG